MLFDRPRRGLLRKSALLIFAGLIGGGIWFFLQNFDIEGLEGIQVKKRGAAGTTFPISATGPETPGRAQWK